jgi:riboflavin biosynthesis pyrimidine reductase
MGPMSTTTSRVDRLWPDPAHDLDLDDAFAELDLPRPVGRPLVALNMVSSVDGRAQLAGRAEGLSGRADRRLMQLYRSAFDAVACGVGTLRADDFYSRLAADLAAARSARGRSAQPTAILIGGAGRIPTDRRWFSEAYADQPRIAVVGPDSPHAAGEPLPGVETWVAPAQPPDPRWLLERLSAASLGSLLLEGGPTTNAAFFAAGSIDELYWTIGARLLGTDALPIIAASAGGTVPTGMPLEGRLISVHRAGDELFLRYRFGALASTDG